MAMVANSTATGSMYQYWSVIIVLSVSPSSLADVPGRRFDGPDPLFLTCFPILGDRL
jgi:hypothetical protein